MLTKTPPHFRKQTRADLPGVLAYVSKRIKAEPTIILREAFRKRNSKSVNHIKTFIKKDANRLND